MPVDFLLAGGIPGDGVDRGLVFPRPEDVAVERAGARYVALGALIEMKLASAMTTRDRPRDLDDVIRLIRANDLGEHLAEAMHPFVREKYRELWGLAQEPPSQPC